MNCRELLCISILIFCTTTSAAPSSNSKWRQRANESKFLRYKSTLLSVDVMPFLSACYDPKCCNVNDEYSCNLYFDVVSWAQETNVFPNVTKDLVQTISPQPIMEFCAALNSTYSELSVKFGHKMPFDGESNTQLACIIGCGNFTGATRPPCAVSLWLLDKVSTLAKQAKEAKVVHTSEALGDEAKSANAALDSDGTEPVISSPQQHDDKEKAPVVLPEKQIDAGIPAKQNEININVPPAKSPLNPIKEKNVKPKAPSGTTIKVTGQQIAKGAIDNGTDSKPPSVNVTTKPTVEIKTTTESSPFGIGPELDKKDKQMADPGRLDDYEDDDMTSNENKPNSVDQMDELNEQDDSLPKVESADNGQTQRVDQDIVIVDGFKEEPSSNFFFYFLFGMFAVIVVYVGYNNKSKIVALVLEGRRSQGGRGRRKHTAAYRKLDSNLEEAIMSAPSGRTTQVIY